MIFCYVSINNFDSPLFEFKCISPCGFYFEVDVFKCCFWVSAILSAWFIYFKYIFGGGSFGPISYLEVKCIEKKIEMKMVVRNVVVAKAIGTDVLIKKWCQC